MNKLYISDAAQSDLAAIKAYIADDPENPAAALAAVGKIAKDIRMLRMAAGTICTSYLVTHKQNHNIHVLGVPFSRLLCRQSNGTPSHKQINAEKNS